MNKLGMIGGIGQGVMQGLQFMRQLDADKRADQALQNQNEILGMQRDVHREKMGEFNRANEERQRTDLLNTLSTRIDDVYKDLPAHERKQMLLDMGAGMGQMKPADIEMVTKARDALVDKFGETAVTALAAGNIGPMQSVLKTQNIDLQADPKTGKYLVKLPGATEPVALDQKGVFGMDFLSGYRSRKAALEKAALEARKTEAEIENIKSKTDLNGRLPQDRFSLSAKGAGAGGAGKEPKPYDPIGTLEDFNKAIGNDPTTNQPYNWAPTALQHYQQILDANPEIAASKQGGQYALNMAQALGKGDAKAVPEIDKNGNINLVASWGGSRKVNLQKNIDPSDLSLVQGVGGSQIVKPEEWVQAQGNAVQAYAKSRPDEYRLAAAASADDAALAQLAESAKKNPDAARAYNFAKMVRELSASQKAAPAQAKDAKQPLTDDEKRVAAALGVDPDEPGLLERAKEGGNRFLTSAKGILSGLNGDQFESGIKMAQRMPGLTNLRLNLLEMARGNPERMARLEQAFGKQTPAK